VAEEIADPRAGFALRPPEAWASAQQDGRIVLAPPENGSFVMAIPHAASNAEELAPILQEGWSEPGLAVTPAASPVTEDGAARVRLAGQAEGEEVAGELVVLFSPHGGGLILLGVARIGREATIRQSLDAIQSSVRFTEPDTEGLLEEWNSALRGRRLVYLYTYSSPGPGGGPAGGFTERHDIVLGERGDFQQSGEFSVAVEGGGGGEVRGPTTGTWEIVASAGQAILELRGDQEPATYVLAPGRESGEVLLNGRRYFVTDP
jgi:hypothetical protein